MAGRKRSFGPSFCRRPVWDGRKCPLWHYARNITLTAPYHDMNERNDGVLELIHAPRYPMPFLPVLYYPSLCLYLPFLKLATTDRVRETELAGLTHLIDVHVGSPADKAGKFLSLSCSLVRLLRYYWLHARVYSIRCTILASRD